MSSSAEEIDNEVCTYSNQPKTEATTAKTVKMSFNKKCENMMVTACSLHAASHLGMYYEGEPSAKNKQFDA